MNPTDTDSKNKLTLNIHHCLKKKKKQITIRS